MNKNALTETRIAARRASRLLVAAVATTLCTQARAAELDVDSDTARVIDALNPYLTVGYGYDSNVYRLDEAAFDNEDVFEPLPVPTKDDLADQYWMVSAGFDTEIERSLQRFQLYAEASHTKFNELEELDYTGSRAGALWFWRLGNLTTGTAGITHKRALRDFANQLSLNRIRDLRMENKLEGSADFGLRGPWRITVRGDIADVSFSETERLDMRRYTTGGAASYTTGAGSSVGIDGEIVIGDYETNPLADYEEFTVGPVFEWKYTEKTSLTARVGYTYRDQEDPLRDDFDGVTGRVVLAMNNPERSGYRLSLYRDLSSLGDEISDFAEVTGIEFEPHWTIREGLDLRLFASYEMRDFNRDLDAELLGLDPNRDDDVYRAGAYVDWQMSRNFKVSFGADLQQRDSTRPLQDYDFNRFEIRFTGSL